MAAIEPNSTPASPSTPSTPSTASAAPKKAGAARFITPALVLAAVLGIGIFGGVLIGQNTSASASVAGGMPSRDGQEMPTGEMPTGAGAMGGLTSGTVVSINGDTITLETSDGEEITVTTSDDTTVTTTEESDVASLAAGDSLTVTGESDDAGDVTATSISEGETAFGGFGGGGGQAPADDE
jgi:hypothetical protein